MDNAVCMKMGACQEHIAESAVGGGLMIQRPWVPEAIKYPGFIFFFNLKIRI